MKRYELIVFDWDGTLMDSAAAIVRAIQASCRDLDLLVPDDLRARHVIGLGLADALGHAVPELPPGRYPEMAERYRHHYLSRDHELTLFAGVEDLLADLVLAGHSLAVATGKSRKGLERALALSGLAAYFQATRCADECFSKPHPQMLDELMGEFGSEPARTLMIGDTSHDLQMARNAGVDELAVTYGAHTAEHLAGYAPRATVHSVDELATWLRNNA